MSERDLVPTRQIANLLLVTQLSWFPPFLWCPKIEPPTSILIGDFSEWNRFCVYMENNIKMYVEGGLFLRFAEDRDWDTDGP